MVNMLTREYLEFQSNRIERVLASHRVSVRVQGGSVTPRWIRYYVAPMRGAEITIINNLSEELALALGAPDVRLAHQGDLLALDIPRPDAKPVYLLSMLRSLNDLPPLTACLGLAEDNRSLLIHLLSPVMAPILVAGATGSGKTELMRTIIFSLAFANRQSRLQIGLIDLKGQGFMPFAELPHLLAPVATSAPVALSLLERLIAEMERRHHEKVSTPHILVAVDELMDLLATGGKPVEIALTQLAHYGHEAGVHLVVGTQIHSASTLDMLKTDLPVRLVGRAGSVDDARIATCLPASGAEKLIGHGDFLAIVNSQTTRFQAAWVPQQDWAEVVKLAPRSAGNRGYVSFWDLAVEPSRTSLPDSRVLKQFLPQSLSHTGLDFMERTMGAWDEAGAWDRRDRGKTTTYSRTKLACTDCLPAEEGQLLSGLPQLCEASSNGQQSGVSHQIKMSFPHRQISIGV